MHGLFWRVGPAHVQRWQPLLAHHQIVYMWHKFSAHNQKEREMLRASLASFRRRKSPLAARLHSVNEQKIDGWVRSRLKEADVASDALALLLMMASGRFLKEHLYPPPRYLGSVDKDVLAYAVLRYVQAAVWHHLPDEWMMLKIDADVFLKRMVKRETGWELHHDVHSYSPRRDDGGPRLAEEFLGCLQKLDGVKQPGGLATRRSVDLQGIHGIKERLLLIGAIAAFQKTIPAGIVATLENLIRAYNLKVPRDERMRGLAGFLRE